MTRAERVQNRILNRFLFSGFLLAAIVFYVLPACWGLVYADTIPQLSDKKFQSELIGMNGEYNKEVTPQQAARNPYIMDRLIVKSSDPCLDPDDYDAVDAIQSREGVYILQFETSTRARRAEIALEKDPATEYVEPDAVLFACDEGSDSAPDDALMNSDGMATDAVFGDAAANGSDSVSLSAAYASSASWNIRMTEMDRYAGYIKENGYNKKKTVAVLDTGISFTHPLLQGRLLTGQAKNFVVKKDSIIDDTYSPDESRMAPKCYGHGTHVAGIIAQCTEGLDVNILPVRVLGANQSGTITSVVMGIEYAVQQGADVINMSIAGPASEKSSHLESSISDAVAKGSVVVVSSGNGTGSGTAAVDISSRIITPAYIGACVVVGSVNQSKGRAESSNYGSTLDVVAPGVSIRSSYIDSNGTNSYKLVSGTSMSAPHVAAEAAMLKMVYPNYTAAQIEQLIQKNASDLGTAGKDAYYGYGLASVGSLLKRTVTYDPGTCGTFTKKSHTVLYGDDTPSAPTPAGKTGYVFTGWSPAVSTTVTKDITYVAQWKTETYTVSFDPGAHGTFAKKSYSVQYGSATPQPPSVTGATGYVFTGWSPAISATVSKNVTYVAQWKAETYTVSFDPGAHGTFAKQSHSVSYGSATPAAPSVTGATGYVFTGWSPAISATVSKNVTYVAQWKAETYTVSFDPGAHGTFAKQSHSVSYGSATPAAPAVTGATGYVFTGWSPAISATVSRNVTYVAQWEAETYTVSFDPGTNGMFARISHSVKYGDPTPAAPAVTGVTGYVFTGWSPAISGTVSNHVTYVAQWTVDGKAQEEAAAKKAEEEAAAKKAEEEAAAKKAQEEAAQKEQEEQWKKSDPHANVTYKVPLKKKQKTSALKVLGLAGGDKVVSWKSSDRARASVKGKADGTCVIKAGSRTGNVNITAVCASGKQAVFRIRVQKNKVETKKIQISTRSLKVPAGKKLRITPQLYPVTSTDKIAYKSDNKKVVSVSGSGVLTARSRGTAVITIKSGTRKLKVKITVK